MYERLNRSQGNALGFRITGALDRTEMQRLTTEIEGSIIAHDTIRVLVDLKAFPYADLGALWADLKFDIKYSGDIERLALIGGNEIEQWSIRMFGKLTRTECRCFEEEQLEEAWAWLTQS